jgi:pimeloyl-ACP methyl ester carboxylesterase
MATDLILKTANVPTSRGNFSVQLLGAAGDWVVCWPAQLNDFESMLAFAQELAKQYRVVLCDPPAVGLNQHLPYTPELPDMVFFARRVLDELGIEQCHWVGQSAGGVVGAALGIALPMRLLSLTLVATPMLSQGRFKLHVAGSTFLLASSRLGRGLLASRAAADMGFASNDEKRLVRQYLRLALERTQPQAIRRMRPLDGADVRRVFDHLRTTSTPLLILCGKHDRIVLPRDQRTVAETTRAQFESLDTGHMSLLAAPQASALAFWRFTQSLKERTALAPGPR